MDINLLEVNKWLISLFFLLWFNPTDLYCALWIFSQCPVIKILQQNSGGQRWELRSEGWEKRPVHCENEYESHTVTRPRLPALQSQTLQEVPTQTGSACVCTCLLRWQCLTLGGAVVYRRHGSIVLAGVRILSRSAVTRRHLQKHTHTHTGGLSWTLASAVTWHG